MLNGIENTLNRISNFMLFGFKAKMNSKEYMEQEIMRWKVSTERVWQITGQLYYRGEHDILNRKRTMIGEDGRLQAVENLTNNHIVDNHYAKLVNQKANYLLGQPFVLECENKEYLELLRQVFDKQFMRTLKNAGKAALNHGIAWLYRHYDREGRFAFRLFLGYEILPVWQDSEHTVLDGAILLYLIAAYEGLKPAIIEKVEVFDMQKDARNTILVLKNYDGVNLGEFRKNLTAYGAIKIRYDNDTKGGVESLEVHVNSENYKVILELFKKALIENGMGFDAKDDRLAGNPNQMNIQSMYSYIDLDANDIQTELQAAFTDILWFVNCHLANTGQGDFFGEQVNVIFNRYMLMDESSIIANCRQSAGILSDETIIGQHPWIDDVQQ